MSEKSINFDDKKIKKSNFYKHKKMFNTDDIYVSKILVFKKEPTKRTKKNAFKYLIGYDDDDEDDEVIKPLCIKLPQMIGYVKCFESNKTMSFKINDDKVLKKYNQTWKKVKNLLNIKFDSEPVYSNNDKYIKTKIKIYDGNASTNFQGKKISKEKPSHKCLSLIMLDSIVKVKKKYYPQKNANTK